MNLHDQLNRDSILLMNTPGGPGTDITILWREETSPSPDYDPNDEDSTPPTMEDREETIRGFAHIPSAGTHNTAYQKFAEIQAGDLILDIPATYDLTEKSDLRFRVGEQLYTQKQVGKDLAAVWAAASTGTSGLRTLLVSRNQ